MGKSTVRRFVWIAPCLALAIGEAPRTVVGQLQITEVMYDSVDDANWEWFEVRNVGATGIDFDGYFIDDTGGNAIAATASPNVWNVANGGKAMNTTVPAGGVAVFYDGDALGFDDNRFRSAWQLAPNIPVVGVDFFPSLNNGGDMFGLWPNKAAYDADTGDSDDDGTLEVIGFAHATMSLDYTPVNGFPDGTEVSIAWNGMGNYQDGTQWAVSEDGVNGATTSIPTFLPGVDQINSTDDIGNPGKIPAGPKASGLLITELMYNNGISGNEEVGWEWIEVHNNTGAAIDFTTTPFVLDDVGGAPLLAANIVSDSIANGETAILFNAGASGITLEQMRTAWGADNKYIPVTEWSALNNGGDTIGIWNGLGPNYQDDKANDVFDTAAAALIYSDSAPWPADNSMGSIYLKSLDLDASDGANWSLSAMDDGFSFHASPVFSGGQPPDHIGGDVGSPGFVPGTEPPTNPADFNGDSAVDCDDIDLLYAEIASGGNGAGYDLNNDGSVTGADVPDFLQAAADARGFPAAIRPGDTNLNGKVDASDLNTLGVNWLSANATSWCAGDFNHDGNVNANDLNDLGVNWLSDVTGNAAPLSASVPEPASGTLLMVAGLLLSLWRKR